VGVCVGVWCGGVGCVGGLGCVWGGVGGVGGVGGGVGCVGYVGCVWGVWGVWVCGGCGGPAHFLRSTFHRLHLLRLWTPTIFLEDASFVYLAFTTVELL
jgi:hypothetical protein